METATETAVAVTTGPATFSEAFAADASSASTPSTETAAQPSASADATVPPAPDASSEGLPQQGEPPKERWPDILENARKKATEETRAQYGGLDADTFKQMAEWYQSAHKDPLTFTTNLIAELQAHPDYGPQLRSLAAKTLAQGRGQQAPAGPDLDGLVIDLGNGQTVPLRDLKASWLQDAKRELEPLAETVKQITTERAQAQAQVFAKSEIERARKEMPGFKEHEADIKAALTKIQLPKDASEDLVRLALKAAYAEVVPGKLQARTAQQAESQLLDNLQKKAQASTVNPGSAAPSSPRRIDSFHDSSLQW